VPQFENTKTETGLTKSELSRTASDRIDIPSEARS
jgi:hypothetical protein